MEFDGAVFIRLRDNELGVDSNDVPIEDVIYNQHDIEFEFPDGSTLPYKDFLFSQDDYDVIVRISGNKWRKRKKCF